MPVRLFCSLVLTLSILGFAVAAEAVPATYAYDAAGRLILEHVGNVRVEYSYDLNGNLLTQTSCVADCFIADECWAQGDLAPTDDCLTCDASTPDAWTEVTDCGAADMGPGADMGTATDMGSSTDMGTTGTDVGTMSDIGGGSDSGAGGGGLGGGEDKGGCSCSVGPSKALDAWPLLFVPMIVSRRRRGRRSRGRRVALASSVALSVMVMGASAAEAVTVCQDGSCDYTTIGQGIANSQPGETISVKPGNYQESNLAVRGRSLVSTTPNDPSGVIIDAQGNAPVIRDASDATFRGITMRNGYNANAPGGAIRVMGAVVLQNMIIEDNEANNIGGGIGTNSGSDLTVVDSIIRNNKSVNVGGGIGGGFRTLIVVGCQILNNETVGTSSGGGGIDGRSNTYSSQYLEIRDSLFDGNRATATGSTSSGAGLRTRTPTTIVRNTTFSNNIASAPNMTYGGGIDVGGGAKTLLENVTVNGNTADQGGGVYLGNGSGALVVSGGSFTNNNASTIGDGGGFYCAATNRLSGFTATVTGNTPDDLAGPCFGTCTAGMTQTCTSSQPGVCSAGQQTCTALGVWGTCDPLVVPPPSELMCTGGLDEDCDGKIDNSDPDCRPARPTTRSQVGGAGRKGEPVSTFTGEFFTRLEPDLEIGGPLPVSFTRYYSSGLDALGLSGSLGVGWRHNFEWSLFDGGTTVSVTGPEGRVIEFEQAGSSWDLVDFTDVRFTLEAQGTGFLLHDPRTGQFYTFDAAGLLAEVSDGTSNRLTLSYSGTELDQVTDGVGRMLSFTYAAGLLTSVSDGTRTVSFAHTGADLTGVTDTLAGTTSYGYAAGGLLTSITLPAGNIALSQTYNANSRVVSQTDANGTTSFAYNDAAGTCAITDPMSGTDVHTHDIRGRLQQIEWADGGIWALGYDSAGRRNSVTDEGGATTQTSFAGGGRPVSRTLPDGLTVTYDLVDWFYGGAFYSEIGAIHYPDGTSEFLTYDGAGNLTSVVDRAGNTATVGRNASGQATSVANHAGGTTTYAYDAAGSLITETDNAGHDTVYSYDALLRRTGTTYADGSTRTKAYDAADRITSITDERGTVRSYSHDANGNLISSTDGEGEVTTMAWDALDRFLSYTDPLGYTASVTYDARGRLASQTNRTGGVTSLDRDAVGRITAMVDANGERWSRTYQANGWLESIADPLGNTLAYERDVAGRITLVRSPLGYETMYGFDMMGRTTSITDPAGGITMIGYDLRGYVSDIASPGGVTSTYARNALGQVTTVTDPIGSDWQFTYDAAGRLLSRTDPLGNQITRTFDARNRPDAFVLPGGLGTVTVSYDGFGNVASQTYSGGPSLNFTYDLRNMITAADGLTLGYDENGLVTSSNGIDLTRDAGGRIATVTYPGGDVTYAYDSGDNLVQVNDWLGNTTTFTYDAAGRQTSVVRSNGVSTTSSYDADNNLVGIDETDGAAMLSSIALQRDGLGNTTSATRDLPTPPTAPSADLDLDYDAASQVDAFTYDALGRCTSDGSRTYSWDAASRLTGYSDAAATVSFTHDGLLQVLSRTEGGTTDEYVWNHGTSRASIAAIRQGGSDLKYYVHSPDGELLYSIDAATGDARYYHFDEMGNTLFLTDDSGAITDTYGYTAYGELTATTGTADNPFTFAGQYSVVQDGPSGLYSMGRRFYDSRTKRFISREPIVDMLHPKTTNPYAYALGNPLRYIDPTGEEGEDKAKGEPTPDALKAILKGTKASTAVIGKKIEEITEKSADVLEAAEQANALNRLGGKKNSQALDSVLDASKKLKKYKGTAEGLGKVGKYVGLAAAGREEGAQALAEFGATELGEKLGGKGGGAIVGVVIEGLKTKKRVDKVQSELKTEQWSNIQNFYRAMDANWESYRTKLINEEEFIRRAKVIQETFDMSTGASKDSGVFGILEESAKGLNDMLWNLVGL